MLRLVRWLSGKRVIFNSFRYKQWLLLYKQSTNDRARFFTKAQSRCAGMSQHPQLKTFVTFYSFQYKRRLLRCINSVRTTGPGFLRKLKVGVQACLQHPQLTTFVAFYSFRYKRRFLRYKPVQTEYKRTPWVFLRKLKVGMPGTWTLL